ncbi:isochorismatase family cysteine hydrolase [Cytobacillus sp. NCCP-133]|uniref:isochorismatase family cysteine hydrolase n=1 Tax=Cytobacillus sp. NCCP-133 TaxID=766848 RepID=UPI00222E7060|nr:isochorismatase family cysteine hydrolase [Cytobacillus sp. NCCP-133]GLB62041.1 putative isochorismatase family protein YaaI [Cytobacillus sp. NCCP-133]
MKTELKTKQTSPALIIIDMINDFNFTHGKILAKKTLKIAEHINKLKSAFHAQELPVIYVNDHYNLWQADIHTIIDYCKNPISEPVLSQVQPEMNDYFLIKPKHSAFYGTALNTLLHQLGVNTLIMTGIAGNICVLFSANDAYMREYHLHIPHNCIASNDDHDNENALKMMEQVLKADVSSFAENNYNISSMFSS